MPKVGDRVVIEGSKVGGGRREGTLTRIVGRMIGVRWEDGTETLFTPGAGSVQYMPGNGKSGKTAVAGGPAKAKAKTGVNTGAKTGAKAAPAKKKR